LARPEGRNYHLMRLEERNLCVEQKDQKPFTPFPVLSDWTDAKHKKTGQLARLRQGQPIDEGRPTMGTGVRRRTIGEIETTEKSI